MNDSDSVCGSGFRSTPCFLILRPGLLWAGCSLMADDRSATGEAEACILSLLMSWFRTSTLASNHSHMTKPSPMDSPTTTGNIHSEKPYSNVTEDFDL